MKTMNVKELKQKLSTNEVCLIDVREPGEYDSERIDGSYHIPLGQISADKVIEKTGPFVIQCRSGKRSAAACEKLLEENPDIDVYNLEGGILAWQAAGYDIKKGLRNVLPMDRQTQILAGSMALGGVGLGFLVHPGFFGLSGFVGAGLITAGVTGWCGSTQVLAMMPWNK